MKGLGKVLIWNKVYVWPVEMRTPNDERTLRAVFLLGAGHPLAMGCSGKADSLGKVKRWHGQGTLSADCLP